MEESVMTKEKQMPGFTMPDETLRKITMNVRLSKQSGKVVSLHVPMTLVKICVEKNVEPSAILGKSRLVRKLDLSHILTRAEQGERGEIVNVTAKSGDKMEIEIV